MLTEFDFWEKICMEKRLGYSCVSLIGVGGNMLPIGGEANTSLCAGVKLLGYHNIQIDDYVLYL